MHLRSWTGVLLFLLAPLVHARSTSPPPRGKALQNRAKRAPKPPASPRTVPRQHRAKRLPKAAPRGNAREAPVKRVPEPASMPVGEPHDPRLGHARESGAGAPASMPVGEARETLTGPSAGAASVPLVSAPRVSMPEAEARALRAERVAEAPSIDGRLLERVWRKLDDLPLTQQEPAPGEPLSQHTRAKVVYDSNFIYFAIRCDDTDAKNMVARLSRRDRWIESDLVSVEIDPTGDRRAVLGFGVWASGSQIDWRRTGDDAYDNDWDAVWPSAVTRDDRGWTVEMAIPLRVLRYQAHADVQFRLQIIRNINRTREVGQWVYRPPSEQGALLRMGVLSGLRDLPENRGIELRPFVLGKLTHRFATYGYDPPSGNRFALSAGGDLALRLGRSLVVDATILPDFGQVESDQVVLNLSTYELFFPEKRPFFLAGADLLALHDVDGMPSATQLFYSRRIGRPPPEVPLADGERLLEWPRQTEIFGALKVSGKLGDSVSVALLDAVSAQSYAVVQGADGVKRLRALNPYNHFAVGRLRAELGSGFMLGATATAVNRLEHKLARGDVCPTDDDALAPRRGRCESDAYTGGVDATWSSPTGTYLASAAFLASSRLFGPDKVMPDNTRIRSGDLGLGGFLQLSKAGGRLLGDLRYEGYSPKLYLNDLGFLRQQNMHGLWGRVGWRTTEPFGLVLGSRSFVEGWGKISFTGIRLAAGAAINTEVRWRSFWNTRLSLSAMPSFYDIRETGDGAAYERAHRLSADFYIASDSRKMVSARFYGQANTLLRGLSFYLDSEIAFKPLDNFELSLGANYQSSSGDPRWVDTANGVYLFGDLSARAVSVIVRGTYTFTPRLSFQVYAQGFVDSGHYGPFYAGMGEGPARTIALARLGPAAAPDSNPDFKDASVNINSVLRWEYLPGSALFVVYTRAHINGDLTPALDPHTPDILSLRRGPSEDVFLIKLSYWFDV